MFLETSETQNYQGGSVWRSCRQRGIQSLPERQVPKRRENEEEMVILLSTPTRFPMAEHSEMPSGKGAKMMQSIEGSLLWDTELSREDR